MLERATALLLSMRSGSVSSPNRAQADRVEAVDRAGKSDVNARGLCIGVRAFLHRAAAALLTASRLSAARFDRGRLPGGCG